MKKSVLNIENLTFGYTQKKLIYKDFDLEIKKGEIKSVVGSSGSGKSTLFELITNNLKPQKGTITSQKISSIYQDPYSSFHPTYSILEQMNDIANDVSELPFLLEKFSLDIAILKKKQHQLSGGQLQRCSIIRAILMKPDLLLADEPTSALDNIIALDVMKLLITFSERFGILLITHDEDLAIWCSDEIINIENNQIIYKE
jgi:peptide/nickel transport system ATP-binding protein